MKKIFVIFVIFSMFMIQLTAVNAEDNINLEGEVYHNMETEVVSCGNNMIEGMPISVPRVVNVVYLIIQISVPVILVVLIGDPLVQLNVPVQSLPLFQEHSFFLQQFRFVQQKPLQALPALLLSQP